MKAKISPLTALRIERDKTLADIASTVGVSVTYVSRWESGQRTPNSVDGEKYAKVLGISQEEVSAIIREMDKLAPYEKLGEQVG